MTRRTRERIVDSAGRERVQDAPRADLLTYPNGWVTVLVRRTHDPAVALPLAAERWNRDGPTGVSLTGPHRAGWWTTRTTSRPPGPGAATDNQGRVVTPCRDDTPGAGAGVEVRPQRRPGGPPCPPHESDAPAGSPPPTGAAPTP